MTQFPFSEPKKTNGFAIAGLVLSILCCSPLGIIFSAISLNQIAKVPNQDGKGLAVAGLVIGIVGLVLGIILWLLSLFTTFWSDFWIGFQEGYNNSISYT